MRALLISVLLLAALVAGCQTVNEASGPIRITNVRVTTAPLYDGPAELVRMVDRETERQLVGTGKPGTPATVNVVITQVWYTDGVNALIIGTVNRVRADVTVRDGAGTVLASFETKADVPYQPHSLLGPFLLRGRQDMAMVDPKLAQWLAQMIRARIYG
ncbi:hypothetical protein RDV64_19000 [Acuticoccus sp. MNP-M23]|uniref:hypothetical protein n=1 Tax=Acuticoccus sp. MNP-M23 TaxID=3072793 RepID=UPI002815135A|nr:hypothetical protein [Acuticoccus sp. MNP-M23]WMS42134.1 hypothetical protein RDV64_19000 [Acuticoccus sp. MNP-M23]